MNIIAVEWANIAIAVVVMQLVGMVWYSKMAFGPLWMQAVNLTVEDARANPGIAKKAMFWNLLLSVVTAYVVALLMGNLIILGVGHAIGTAVLLWLAFNFAFTMPDYLWTLGKRPLNYYLITQGYQLVAVILTVLIVSGIWGI
jgi:hypothetical protein